MPCASAFPLSGLGLGVKDAAFFAPPPLSSVALLACRHPSPPPLHVNPPSALSLPSPARHADFVCRHHAAILPSDLLPRSWFRAPFPLRPSSASLFPLQRGPPKAKHETRTCGSWRGLDGNAEELPCTSTCSTHSSACSPPPLPLSLALRLPDFRFLSLQRALSAAILSGLLVDIRSMKMQQDRR